MTTLFFYRNGAAGRVRWRFVIDERQTIVEEAEAPEPETTTAVVDERGNRTITHISEEDRRSLSFFALNTPCWFPECENLRRQYRDELTKLSPGCPACQKGALVRKYQALVKQRMGAQPA